MSALIVLLIFLATLIVVAARGPRFAFNWCYFPVLALVPLPVVLEVVGLPDFTARRAVIVAVLLALLGTGGLGALFRRLRWWDGLALTAVLWFAIAYGVKTDAMGFVHRFLILALDWGAPYLLARALLRQRRDLSAWLLPLTVATGALALLCVYEARMASRAAVDLWNTLGLNLTIGQYRYGWRWGYLRAFGTFGHPILLGTYFAAVVPLMFLWGRLRPAEAWFRWLAVLAAVAGCGAALSRGPWLALAVAGSVFTLLALRATGIVIVGGIVGIAALPFVAESLGQHLTTIRELVDTRGNTPNQSAYYRVALFLMYGTRLGEVGWFGNRDEIVGQGHYEDAWSLDNAFLWTFFVGGWVGGGAVAAFSAVCLTLGIRGIAASRGRERVIRSCLSAAFATIVVCMLDVWFAADYAPLFWITGSLVINHAGPKGRPTTRAPPPYAHRSQPPAPLAPDPGGETSCAQVTPHDS